MSVHHLAELTCEHMSLRTRDVLVLPLGSTEQHGPHLPMGTDTLLAGHVANHAAAQAGAHVDLVVAPEVAYGVSGHHLFAGAASVRPTTYYHLVMDLLGSLAESGFSRFFLLNGHGGNHESLGVVSKSAPLELGVSVAVCSYWNTVAGALSDLGVGTERVPGHAGLFETSLVLAVHPRLVDMGRAPEAGPEPPPAWARPLHPGLDVQMPGEWARVGGYSDAADGADERVGKDIFARVSHEVALAIESFVQVTDRQVGGEEDD